jgi:hypothetical protein
MNGVLWHIKTWDWVVKHISVGLQDILRALRNPVMTLATVNGSEVEWSKDISVQMSEVQKLAVREEVVLVSVGLRCL